MKQAFNPLHLIKDNKLVQDARALYVFFTEAETSGTRFTYAKIHDHFPRSPSNISKYARNYWSWFLRREPEKLGRASTFSCHGLKEYPEFYFVMAHQRNQGQYYRHFSEALLKARERDQARRVKLQETTEVPSSPSPNVPGQQDPEELHIEELPPDEEAEEDEMETEQPQDLDEGIQLADDNGTTSEIAQSKGGINLMSIFTLDKQLDQIRTEFTQKIDLLEQKLIKEVQRLGEAQRLHVPPEISQVLKELGQLQEQVLAFSSLVSQPTPLLERQGEMAIRIQTIEQTLLGGIQQLHILTTLSQLPERLEQVRKQVQESFLSFPEQLELFQAQTSNLSASVASTPTKLEQLQAKMDELLSQFAQESPLLPILQELQRQIAERAQPSSVPDTLEQLPEQGGEISSQALSASGVPGILQQANENLRAELVPPIPSGEQKPDDLIQARIQQTIRAINALGQDLSIWLERHYLTLSRNGQVSDEKLRQDFTSFMETYLASQQAQRLYRIQENIPVSTEALPPGEQIIPLIDQPSETDTANDTMEEGNFPQPNEDEEE
jgi:hypothetical protein